MLCAQVRKIIAAGKSFVPHTIRDEIVLTPDVGLEGLLGLPCAASHDVKCCHEEIVPEPEELSNEKCP